MQSVGQAGANGSEWCCEHTLWLFQGHEGVKCHAPYYWLSHLHQAARSPGPPCIDLIWPRDKAVIGWGLGIRWPCLAWLIPLFLGRLGPGPKGQAKVNPIQSPVLRAHSLPYDLTATQTQLMWLLLNKSEPDCLIGLPEILQMHSVHTRHFICKRSA